jgi:hypothetical protein
MGMDGAEPDGDSPAADAVPGHDEGAEPNMDPEMLKKLLESMGGE